MPNGGYGLKLTINSATINFDGKELDYDSTYDENCLDQIIVQAFSFSEAIEEEEGDEMVGSLTAYLSSRTPFHFDNFDEVSQDVSDVACVVNDILNQDDGPLEFKRGGIIILDRMKINKEHRGQGIAREALRLMVDTLVGLGLHDGVIFTSPEPFELNDAQKEARNDERKRLIKYYRSLGFQYIKGRNVMAFQLCNLFGKPCKAKWKTFAEAEDEKTFTRFRMKTNEQRAKN